MRWVLALVAVVACKKDTAPPLTHKGSASAPGDATIAQVSDGAAADTVAANVDLFRAVPVQITVSSRVANPKIKLEHLVDRDMNTAWNSRTGDLVGAWLEIALPANTIANELRLTVGHTGKGPKGEDYFTMNPRIRTIHVRGIDKPITLDIDKRTLQSVPLPALTGTIHVDIYDVAKGTKPRWREACISELEVWGVPPPGTQLPGTQMPTVAEAPPDVMDELCKPLDPNPDPAYPLCSIEQSVLAIDAPWSSPAVLHHVTNRVEHHGHLYSESIEESLVLVASGKAWQSPVINQTEFSDGGNGEPKEYATTASITDVALADAVAGGAQEIAVTYRLDDSPPDATSPTDYKDYVIVCATDRTCSDPVLFGTQDWQAQVRIAPGTLTRVGDNKVPAKELGKTTLKLH